MQKRSSSGLGESWTMRLTAKRYIIWLCVILLGTYIICLQMCQYCKRNRKVGQESALVPQWFL